MLGPKPPAARHLPRPGRGGGGRSGWAERRRGGVPSEACLCPIWFPGDQVRGDRGGSPPPPPRRVGHNGVSKHQTTLIRKDGHSVLLRVKGTVMIHLLEEERGRRKEKEKEKKKKKNSGRRNSAGRSWSALKNPQCPTLVVGKGRLPCKPLWPDTSSPDPGAETCVSASDTCPGKACGP